MKPRFTLVLLSFTSGFPYEEEKKFFSPHGLEQWLDNARATGEVGEQDKVAIYDDSGVRL